MKVIASRKCEVLAYGEARENPIEYRFVVRLDILSGEAAK
jgi:hypothetical protein